MKLVNVRLNEDDAAKAEALKKQGIQLSSLMRQAIRDEYERQHSQREHIDTDAVLERIYAEHPLPADQATPPVDTTDRRAFREHILTRLRRKRS
jgi:hypothetical protein